MSHLIIRLSEQGDQLSNNFNKSSKNPFFVFYIIFRNNFKFEVRNVSSKGLFINDVIT